MNRYLHMNGESVSKLQVFFMWQALDQWRFNGVRKTKAVKCIGWNVPWNPSACIWQFNLRAFIRRHLFAQIHCLLTPTCVSSHSPASDSGSHETLAHPIETKSSHNSWWLLDIEKEHDDWLEYTQRPWTRCTFCWLIVCTSVHSLDLDTFMLCDKALQWSQE